MPFGRGYTPWNKGKGSASQIGAALRGRKSPWVGRKNSELVEEKSRRWKGNDVGYMPLHRWVERHLGKSSECAHCGSTREKRYEWANVSGEYRRDLDDWIRPCRSCHIRYDRESGRWDDTTLMLKMRAA